MNNNQLRIIGGRWRGRRISFPDSAGLRPTGDRIRETLFNWLQNDIQDAHCLDLFSGSGALGFEALSRGAASVTFVDQNAEVITYLHATAEKLSAKNINVMHEAAPAQSLTKKLANRQFSIVFIDPPFHQGLIEKCCAWLIESNLLSKNALIYLEAERELSPLPIPANWELLKSKITGQVGYHLVRSVFQVKNE